MKKKIIILIVIVILSTLVYFIWGNINSDSSSIPVFSTQEECQKATGSICRLQLCDYKCPRDFKRGWTKI